MNNQRMISAVDSDGNNIIMSSKFIGQEGFLVTSGIQMPILPEKYNAIRCLDYDSVVFESLCRMLGNIRHISNSVGENELTPHMEMLFDSYLGALGVICETPQYKILSACARRLVELSVSGSLTRPGLVNYSEISKLTDEAPLSVADLNNIACQFVPEDRYDFSKSSFSIENANAVLCSPLFASDNPSRIIDDQTGLHEPDMRIVLVYPSDEVIAYAFGYLRHIFRLLMVEQSSTVFMLEQLHPPRFGYDILGSPLSNDYFCDYAIREVFYQHFRGMPATAVSVAVSCRLEVGFFGSLGEWDSFVLNGTSWYNIRLVMEHIDYEYEQDAPWR